MAVTTTDTTLDLLKWRKSFWREWNRENLFSPYIGQADQGARSVIHQLFELRDAGENISVPLVLTPSGAGQTGSSTLAGNEEALDNYGHNITIDWARHAILLNKKEMRKSAADQMAVVKPSLMDWAQNKIRDDIINALFSYDGTLISSASEGARDTWTANNSDRVLFGAATTNNSSNDHSASLANLDTTADTMRVSITTLAKRLARAASPKIKPMRVNGGREYFVMFHGSRAFRDLSEDSVMTQANREARPRDTENNPLFQDGDLIYKGVIHREIPEIDDICVLAGAGASSADVVPSFLCGAQALGYAIGQMPMPTVRTDDDYGFTKGRGVEMCYAVDKIIFNGTATSDNNKDWGMLTCWVAAAAD